MGAKDSKLSCISYEEAIKRGKVFFFYFINFCIVQSVCNYYQYNYIRVLYDYDKKT